MQKTGEFLAMMLPTWKPEGGLLLKKKPLNFAGGAPECSFFFFFFKHYFRRSTQYDPLAPTVSKPKEWASSMVCSLFGAPPSSMYDQVCLPSTLESLQRLRSVAGSVLYGPPRLRKCLGENNEGRQCTMYNTINTSLFMSRFHNSCRLSLLHLLDFCHGNLWLAWNLNVKILNM